MEKYQNKYRIPSARAEWWDYGWTGAYFITICTENKKHFLGKIVEGNMILSDAGIIAEKFWKEIPDHFPCIDLGDFVIMPNHIHGILFLNQPIVETLHATSQSPHTDETSPVETLHATSLLENTNETLDTAFPKKHANETSHATSLQMSAISPKANTISAIIRSYKSIVSKHAKQKNIDYGWQTRFYDHIIRNYIEYQKVSDYIINNPLTWEEDPFYEHHNRKNI